MKKLKILTAVFAFAMFANLFGEKGSKGELTATPEKMDFAKKKTSTITVGESGDAYATDGDPKITFSPATAGTNTTGTTVTFTGPGIATIIQKWKASGVDDPDGGKETIPPNTVSKITVTAFEFKELSSVEFTSDHDILTDYNADYAGSGGTKYTAPEWTSSTNNPISHSQNKNITAKISVIVLPAGETFDLKGTCDDTFFAFDKAGNTSTGAKQEITATSTGKLPAKIQSSLSSSVDWTIKSNSITTDKKTSGAHKGYVTWGTPTGGGYTKKRIEWVTQKANGATTEEGCADKLHTAVVSNTTFGNGGQVVGFN